MCACTSDVGRNLERIERQVTTAPDSAYSALCAIDRLQIVESTENAMRYLGFGLMRSFGQEDIEIIDTIVNEAIEGDDLSFFNKLRELYPNRSREIQALEYYLYTVQNYSDINVIRNYTDGFIETVNNGSINNDIKKSIGQNVSIAPASFELWTYIDKLESK